MNINLSNRNQLFAFRTTRDFTSNFDDLCDRLGFNRSEVCRYALRQFMNLNWTPETVSRVRSQMY